MNSDSVRATIDSALKQALPAGRQGRSGLSAAEAGDVCRAYGIGLPQERVAADVEAAVVAAEAIGYPVALKVLSEAISHKSDAGGIALGLTDAAAVRGAFEQIILHARDYNPTAKVDGVLVQQMARPGREVIIGAITDPTFGKVVMAGLGGIFVETLKDVTFALAPVTKERARQMFAEIKGAAVLEGVRGERPVDFDALCDVVVKVSKLVTAHPEESRSSTSIPSLPGPTAAPPSMPASPCAAPSPTAPALAPSARPYSPPCAAS